jgi:hypothetical protein
MADTPTTTDTTAPAGTVAPDQPATPPATAPAQARASFTAEQQEEVNRIAARAREEGKQSAQRKSDPPKPTSQPAQAADAPSGLTLADVQRMIAREGEFVTALTSAGLDDDQKRSVRSLFNAANPTDVGAWWKETIEPLKLGKSPAPTAATTTAPVTATQPQSTATGQPAQPSAPPVSDRGAPPASKVPLEEAYLPTMSQADRDALIKSKGARWYMDQLSKQLSGKAIDLRRR